MKALAITHIFVQVPATEHDLVVVDEPYVFIHNIPEVVEAAARLIDEETDGLCSSSSSSGRLSLLLLQLLSIVDIIGHWCSSSSSSSSRSGK
jgi:hypothetical protein